MRPKLKEEGSPMESYVGLDVHSKRSVFVIEAEDGRVVARGDIPTTPAGFRQLRQQHELAAETPVALETGTVAFYAARELARVGLRPVVIDAHELRVKAHRPRQKSDRLMRSSSAVTQHHALWRCARKQIVAPEENARRPAGDDHQGRGAPPDRA